MRCRYSFPCLIALVGFSAIAATVAALMLARYAVLSDFWRASCAAFAFVCFIVAVGIGFLEILGWRSE